jgi:tetratricopeptide (TPR) repeat protein
VACALVPVSALPARALDPPAFDLVCGEAEAYSGKFAAGERKRLLEEARSRARVDLARRLWSEALGEVARGVMPPGSTGRPAEKALASLGARYGVAERTEGGQFYLRGGKRHKSVQYCLSSNDYNAARDGIREQRRRTVQSFGERFALLEGLIDLGDLATASRTLGELEVEVMGEALEDVLFESPREGRALPYHVWLLEWSEELPGDEDLVTFLIERASALLEKGQLEEASRYLSRASHLERGDERVRALRVEIEERRGRRVELLAEVEPLAVAGDFDEADERIAEARRLVTDNPEPVLEAEALVAGYRAEYRANNPGVIPGVFMSVGSIALDEGETGRRVGQAVGQPLDPLTPLSLGAGASFRVSGPLIAGVAADWGVVQDSHSDRYGNPVELFHFAQLSAGVGYRSTKRPGGKMSVRVLGGPVWHWAELASQFRAGPGSSSSKLGWSLRVSLDWTHLAVYLQHGLGFEDDPDSLIAWSDGFQVGFGANF